MMKVYELRKNKVDLLSFIDFAWDIYQDNPNWVPPLKRDLLKILLGRDVTKKIHCGPHAFLMVWEKQKPLARLLVGLNEKKNTRRSNKVGFFGYLESVNSSEVFHAIIDYAINWLRGHRINAIIGPVCPNDDVDSRGMLIKGFNLPPVLMNSYNPAYYRNLIEGYGFEKDQDFYAYHFDHFEKAKAKVDKVATYASQKFHFSIDKINLKYLDREIKDVIKILDDIVSDGKEEENGFEYANPPTYEELSLEVKQLLPLIDEDLIYIARQGDRPIGFVFAFPDYNQVLKRMNGKLFPFGFLKYLWFKRKIKGMRGFAQYVIPEFRNKAVNAAIFQKILNIAVIKKYEYIEGSLISENNLRSRRIFENAGMLPYKVYRVYRKEF